MPPSQNGHARPTSSLSDDSPVGGKPTEDVVQQVPRDIDTAETIPNQAEQCHLETELHRALKAPV